MNQEFMALMSRLAMVAPGDPLWLGIQEWLRQNREIEIQSLCVPGISDSEVHRGRGRLGMVIDLTQQLDELLVRAQKLNQNPGGS